MTTDASHVFIYNLTTLVSLFKKLYSKTRKDRSMVHVVNKQNDVAVLCDFQIVGLSLKLHTCYSLLTMFTQRLLVP